MIEAPEDPMHRSLLFAGIAMTLAGCGPEEKKDGPVDTYVGTVDGSDAVVAIAIQADGDVIGYSCGGPLDLQVMTTWISGPLSGNTFELERGDGTITGAVGDGVVTGLVDLDVVERTFTATLTVRGGAPGLYGAGLEDKDCLTGVVVLPGGAIQGASTCGAPEDMFNQVTPGAVPTDGTGFEVIVDAWSATPFLVTPVNVAPRY